MYAATVGRTFLKAYNRKFEKEYTGKTFFEEVFVPLFFDHTKYMMTAGNSPIENPKLSWDKMIKGQIPFETLERRKERYKALIQKIDGSDADASIAIGYPTLDVTATTSGQVTSMNIGISKEDVYLSWIGAGLGVGVQGGFSILFNNKQILLDLFDGWEKYREELDNTMNLKGNQITTWNGQWLIHRYSDLFVKENPMANFDILSTNKDGIMSIDIQSWTKILIAISKKIDNPQMMGYVYNFGQTNTTIGFIPFVLQQIRRPVELYQKIFGIDSAKKAEPLWGTEFGFQKACQVGVIGLKTMEPKGLIDYIKKGETPRFPNTGNDEINFNTYKIWIMAMLNNEDLWAKAKEFAEVLQSYAQSGKRGKTENPRKVSTVLESTNKLNFIKSLVDVVEVIEDKEKIEEIVKVVNVMPTDNVPYFLTLIRFNYAAINNIKK